MYRNEMRTKKGQEKKGTKNLPIREYCTVTCPALLQTTNLKKL
jgi:hypothetical protein